MIRLAIISLLLLAACGQRSLEWGTVTEVDKDNRIIFSSLWHYTVEMDNGSIRSGRLKTIIKKGWRVGYDRYGRISKILSYGRPDGPVR